MSLSYNIDKLLEKTDNINESVTDEHENGSNQSFSDNEDLSDESISPKYDRPYDRRNKSRASEDIRLRVNSRERQRMHDLNSALDGLRQALPYSHGPSVKKISKMATLVLARNYIVMLNKSLDEMKKLVTEMSMKQAPQPRVPSTVTSSSSSVSPERLSAPMPISSPFSSNKMAPLPPLSTDIHKISPIMPMHSLYLPYRLSTTHQTTHLHGGVSPLCPCNFCQVSVTSLPKPEWN